MLLTFAVLPSQAQQIYYAAPNANGSGGSWNDPGDLETLLSLVPDGSQVWAMHGLYNIGSSIVIDRSLSVYGGFEGNESSIEERGLVSHNYSILNSAQTAISSMLCVNVDPYLGVHPITNISHFKLDGFYFWNACIPGWGGAFSLNIPI